MDVQKSIGRNIAASVYRFLVRLWPYAPWAIVTRHMRFYVGSFNSFANYSNRSSKQLQLICDGVNVKLVMVYVWTVKIKNYTLQPTHLVGVLSSILKHIIIESFWSDMPRPTPKLGGKKSSWRQMNLSFSANCHSFLLSLKCLVHIMDHWSQMTIK